MHVRVCPECGEEFRPEIVVCSDCGATLEDRYEGDEEGGALTPRHDAPPEATEPDSAFVPVFRADRAADVEPLAVRLGQEGIPFRVRSAQQTFALLVREADEEGARAVLGEMLRSGAPADVVEEPPFDPEAGYSACPACGCRLAPRVAECPDCGLAVGPADEQPS